MTLAFSIVMHVVESAFFIWAIPMTCVVLYIAVKEMQS